MRNRSILVLLLCFSCLPLFGQGAGPQSKVLSGLNQCLTINTSPTQTSGVYIDVGAGVWSMTLTAQASVKGSAFKNVAVTPTTSQTQQATITATGAYNAAVAGPDKFQVCATSYSSGSVTVTLSATTGVASNLFGGGGSGGTGTPGGGVDTVQFNAGGGNFGGITNWTTSGVNDLTAGATSILDLHGITTGQFLVPAGAGKTASATQNLVLDSTAGYLHGWNAGADSVWPHGLANASHKWLNSYTLATGVFTQTQPSSTDLSDISALTGILYGNGGSSTTVASASQLGTLFNTYISGLTGCATPGYVYTPAGTDCVAQSGGVSITVNGGSSVASPVNFQNGSAVNGQTINASNPSGSNIQFAVTSGSDLTVVGGGTGVATVTAHSLLIGEGTSAFANTGAGTQYQFLISNGASDPGWSAYKLPSTGGSNAQCLTSNGTDAVWGSCASGSIGGSGTANTISKFTAAATIGNSLLTDDATTLGYSGTGGLKLSAGPLELTEIVAPSGIASNDLIYGDSTAHRPKVNSNNGGATTLALFTDNLSVFAATTSAQLAGVISDETGTGVLVFGTSPAFTTDIHCNSAGGCTLGTAALPASSVYVGGSATNNIQLTGTATGARVATFPNVTGGVALDDSSVTTTTFVLHATATGHLYDASAIVVADLPTVTVAKGGTGLTTLSAHGLLIGEGTSNISVTATGTQYQVLQSGGAAGDPAWSAYTLPASVAANQALYATGTGAVTSGTLPVAAGGSGATTFTIHGVLIGETASAFNATSAGTSGQPLLSGGAGADPNWGTLSASFGGSGLTTATAHGVLFGEGTSAFGVSAAGTSGQPLLSGGASADPAYGTLGVNFGGTGVTTITAHSIPIGEGTSAFANTGAGTQYEFLISNGASDPGWSSWQLPSTGGTNAQCLTSNGTNAVWGSCTTGSITGSGLVATQVAVASGSSAITSYSGFTSDASGNVTANTYTSSSTGAGLFYIGQGTAQPTGTTSVGLTGPTSITSYNIVVPSSAAAGTNGATGNFYLKLSSSTSQTGCTASSTNLCGYFESTINLASGSGDYTGILPTTNGGSGINAPAAHTILLGEGSSAFGTVSVGATGTVLIGNSSADPSFSTTLALGNTGNSGTITITGSSSGTISLLPQAAAGTYNWNWPTTAGSNGQCLTSAGGGASVMTWGACGGAVAWSGITAPSGNLSLSMVANTTTFTYGNATGAGANLFNITDTASNTGTGYMVTLATAASSVLNPFLVQVQGNNAIQVNEISAGGAQQQIVFGVCPATPSTSDVARVVNCAASTTAILNRVFASSASYTGKILQVETATAAGSGFELISGRTGCSTDGACGSGAEVFNVLGNGTITLGTASTTAGSVVFYNATSGSITLSPATGALGSVTATLPANTGTIGELNLAQTWSALQTFGSNASIAGTAHGLLVSENTSAVVALAAGTAGQIVTSGGASADPGYIDFPERFYIPAANCNNTTAGAGWSIGASGVVTCRAGTNNLGGYITITDTSSSFAQFTLMIPVDWDSGTRPYIKFYFSSASDTTNGHTVIPQVKVSCPTAANGTVSDDATFSAAQSSSTVTFGGSAVANGFYNGSSVQFGSTQMTGCIAGGMMIVQIGRATDTATGNINFYGADVTFPRLLAVQAN